MESGNIHVLHHERGTVTAPPESRSYSTALVGIDGQGGFRLPTFMTVMGGGSNSCKVMTDALVGIRSVRPPIGTGRGIAGPADETAHALTESVPVLRWSL